MREPGDRRKSLRLEVVGPWGTFHVSVPVRTSMQARSVC